MGRRNVTAEFKEQAARQVIQGGPSFREVADNLGLDQSSLRHSVRLARASGADGSRADPPSIAAMSWIDSALNQPTVAGSLITLGVVGASGLALGSIKVRGIGLGVAGVLFAGLLAGRMGVPIEPDVLHFLRDAGLILFVFAIGLQIGPGFIDSLRRSGLRLNLAAGGGVVLATLLAAALALAFGLKPAVIVGVLAGATTNTPSLAAAQAVLTDRLGPDQSALATAGYAVAYPMGVLGTIVAMLLIRLGLPRAAAVDAAQAPARPLARASIEITNPNIHGVELARLSLLADSGLVVTRRLSQGIVTVPDGRARLETGDVLLVVGPESRIEEVALLLGRRSEIDLREVPSEITSRRLVVTRREVLGRSIRELDLAARLGVTISRVARAGVELAPTGDFRFNFADSVLAVGPAEGLRQLGVILGDSARRLEHSHLIPLFSGIALGVALGSVPITIPGLPGTVKLGLAGGPLIVAILLARVGRIGPVVCYLPTSANFALREIGMVLFLACVGVGSGHAFVESAASWAGLSWFGVGVLLTLLPVLAVGVVGRFWLRLDQPTLLGLIAGGMTDPPALAFASSLTHSESSSLSYSTVYPLTMLMRIVCIQILAILLT